jgi:hypothetical protein
LPPHRPEQQSDPALQFTPTSKQHVFGAQANELQQTLPAAHVQLTEPPQPSEAVMPHWPLQGLGFGAQQFVA